MNERIEKLKESACPKIDWAARYHVELNNGEKEKWMNEWFEKFAELIVKECVDICQDIDGEDNIDAMSGRQDCAVEIKEHFGVEE